ncbi:Hypothetical predicted protein [Marmota monax]|uniref:Uncharacterized protein n=1 Tax=Marmota monax TaxID=9995 RepID=A0A5E4D498_MARMO|nr:hypothetical protein GHT09_015766 [Marmota monax]VTJ88470.1 Hypothetical predicted protein [Marmota monax]
MEQKLQRETESAGSEKHFCFMQLPPDTKPNVLTDNKTIPSIGSCQQKMLPFCTSKLFSASTFRQHFTPKVQIVLPREPLDLTSSPIFTWNIGWLTRSMAQSFIEIFSSNFLKNSLEMKVPTSNKLCFIQDTETSK